LHTTEYVFYLIGFLTLADWNAWK